ncbi:MAG: isoamylase early set domain-containing protein [Flavobacterium sp.]|jgi:1,4-alpha-glucan branching enzyme
MAIKKQFVKSKSICKVTFSLEALEAENASVIGDFNNWDAKKGVLNKQKNGTFKNVIEVATGAKYEFRYLVDGTYINDPEADAFIWNEFANAENCLLEA